MAKSVTDVKKEYAETAILRCHAFELECAKNAELAKLESRLRAARAAALERVLAGQEPDGELERLEAEEAEIISRIAFPRYACAKCADSGEADGKHCQCLRDKIYADCYGAVDIKDFSQSFDTFDLEIFDGEAVLPAGVTQRVVMGSFLKRAQEYIANFPDTVRKNILMTGKAGLGKTYLMVCMAKEARRLGIDMLFMRAGDLHNLFFAKRMDESVDLSYLQNAALLFIDDLGTEPVTQNVSAEGLYGLLSKRLEQGRHTVVATNVDDLQKRYDDRIASRLLSKTDSLRFYFDGRDLRRA